MPTTNVGTARLNDEYPATILSIHEPLRFAEIRPNGMPSPTPINIVAKVS